MRGYLAQNPSLTHTSTSNIGCRLKLKVKAIKVSKERRLRNGFTDHDHALKPNWAAIHRINWGISVMEAQLRVLNKNVLRKVIPS